MELRHLRYFLAVAEEAHFGRAAERLHIVQPALSMQIRALEDEIGGPLFTRTSRRVELTEAGKLFRQEAQRTIAQADRAKHMAQQSVRGIIGSVRIGFAGAAVFAGDLLDSIQRFHARSPQVALEIREIAPQLQPDAIVAGELDIAYRASLGLGVIPSLKVERIGAWPWAIAMSAAHILAGKARLSPRMLADEDFIIYSTDDVDSGQIAVLRQLLGREPRIAHRVSSTLSVLALAAAGLGLAIVPSTLTAITVPNIVYKRVGELGGPHTLVRISRADESHGAVLAFLATPPSPG
jgi:DNA-binding transcriptional LysR family regulator